LAFIIMNSHSVSSFVEVGQTEKNGHCVGAWGQRTQKWQTLSLSLWMGCVSVTVSLHFRPFN
jgi:hypothetical protein